MARRHHAVDCEAHANWDETADLAESPDEVDVDCGDCGHTNSLYNPMAGDISRGVCEECGEYIEVVG